MEVWFRSFSPVKICRFHGHLPECRSYSGVSLCFTISGLYQDILRYKDDNSVSGSLLTDQHIQQKCNQVFFHPSLGRAKVKRFFFLRGSCDENRVAVLIEAKAYFVARNYALSLRNWMQCHPISQWAAVPRQPRRNLAKFVRKQVGHVNVRLETIKMDEKSFCYVVLFQSFLMLGDVQFDNAHMFQNGWRQPPAIFATQRLWL